MGWARCDTLGGYVLYAILMSAVWLCHMALGVSSPDRILRISKEVYVLVGILTRAGEFTARGFSPGHVLKQY